MMDDYLHFFGISRLFLSGEFLVLYLKVKWFILDYGEWLTTKTNSGCTFVGHIRCVVLM